MSSVLVISSETFNMEIYYKAVEQLVARYTHKEKSWLDTARLRIFDTQYCGIVTKGKRSQEKYLVKKNPKFDNMDSKLQSYIVYVNGFFTWCQCSISRRSFVRKAVGNPNAQVHSICTHIGAALMFKFYTEELLRGNLGPTVPTYPPGTLLK